MLAAAYALTNNDADVFLIELELSKILGPLLVKIFGPPKRLVVAFAAYSVPLFAVNKLVDLRLENIPIP